MADQMTGNGDMKKVQAPGLGIIRERSFVRTPNHQQQMKRRSLMQIQPHQQQQMRMKPALEIYRPPNHRIDGLPQNKLNVHAQEFTMNRSAVNMFAPQGNNLQHSKSSGNMQQQQFGARPHPQMTLNNLTGHRTAILLSHPLQMGQLGMGIPIPGSQIPLVNSQSSGNILHSAPRVKFAPEPQVVHTPTNQVPQNYQNPNPLQRSKSLSSADTIARGIAGLGLALGSEATDIGTFPPEVQVLVDKATEDPNQLNARNLMELACHVMQRAVEARRYALPISRFCIAIVAKERKETFLEALLNTCRQWFQERDKVLGPAPNTRNNSRPRFTAFMAFLTEMFCQMKRRQLQLRTQCDGVPPTLVLLTLLSKCCEDAVRPPIRSLSEIECLFYVLTCIGRDLEIHLAPQLESLLASVRDAFLNSASSSPAIRRTLLQLIELQASRWQLPGNTVLYYYPSSK
uniref:Putative mif4g domain-containing protein n=1 Tax=Nyssomyia neivai TaxID=330878 RepID=A0A1L8DRX8_9DIPT